MSNILYLIILLSTWFLESCSSINMRPNAMCPREDSSPLSNLIQNQRQQEADGINIEDEEGGLSSWRTQVAYWEFYPSSKWEKIIKNEPEKFEDFIRSAPPQRVAKLLVVWAKEKHIEAFKALFQFLKQKNITLDPQVECESRLFFPDRSRCTPLDAVIENELADVIPLLIDSCPSIVNKPTSIDDTFCLFPFQRAIKTGNPIVVQTFGLNCIPADRKNDAFIWAFEKPRLSVGDIQIINNLLLDRGVPSNGLERACYNNDYNEVMVVDLVKNYLAYRNYIRRYIAIFASSPVQALEEIKSILEKYVISFPITETMIQALRHRLHKTPNECEALVKDLKQFLTGGVQGDYLS